jgi:hypothetical protein
MNTGTYPVTRIIPPHRAHRAGVRAKNTKQVATDDDARSAGNIQAWRSYLPEDCVGTMIKMGWDRTV